MSKKEIYEKENPVCVIYKGWKIRAHDGLFICNQCVDVMSVQSANIDIIYEKIDNWIKGGYEQDKNYY